MNQCCKELYRYFKRYYPTFEEEIYEIVVMARLKGTKSGENLETMTDASAEDLREIFSRVSEKHLVDWVYGILASEREEGSCYDIMHKHIYGF